MRQLMLLVTCAVAAVMLGCVPSLQPLYSEKDPILLASLAGTWVSADSKEKFIFKADEQEIKYEVTCTDQEGGTGKLEARLLRLGKHLFLDTTVSDLPEVKCAYPKCHLLPAHLFTKIEIEGDVLRYATLHFDWIKKGLEQKKITIRHEAVKDMTFLTASTKELQEFVLAHAGEKDAFQEPKELRRQK
ncbi:MAG: hypothetical protein HZC54_15415 [Verrucomicrobia bacterium]|nr:hypothetical protein [Verrucomicrobiota bacterium]